MSISLDEKYDPRDRWRAVVEHGKWLLVVNAGPGTGKTFSLLRKIEALLKNGVDPSTIYYLTFVNSIVDAFSADVAKPVEKSGLGIPASELGIKISTLHSIGLKVLRVYARQLGLAQHIEIVNITPTVEDAPSSLIYEDAYFIARDAGLTTEKKEYKEALSRLHEIWRKRASVPDDLSGMNSLLEQLGQKYAAMPWDRLVPLAIHAIESFGLPSWLAEAKHFLVDEYQDFNPAEQKFIELISEPSDSVVIVGDMDQSIYSSRSASPEGMQALLDRDDVSTVNFVLCRRCPRRIIGAANRMLALIDPHQHTTRQLIPFKEDYGVLEAKALRSCKAELDFIADEIQKCKAKKLGEIAILMPGRRGMEYYQQQLEKRGIQCRIHGDHGDGSNSLTALLRLALLGEHPLLERVLLSTYPPLERRFRRDVLPPMINDSLSLHEALAVAEQTSPWRQDVRDAYARFQADHSALTSKEPGRIREVLTSRGFDVPEEIIRQLLADDEDTVASRVDKALASLKERQGGSGDEVVLLTMHSSKGLSKPVVIMPALEDKWIPGDARGTTLEEKHRLFYVALTRAERFAILTYPRTRARGDPLNYTPNSCQDGPSRYLAHLGFSF
jgi:DNA helicase-2/ATP-dependent DNA helicase PcrA